MTSTPSSEPSPAGRRQFDNVEVMSLEDGSVIEGHDAVEAYFEREQQLYDAHGSSITFEVYRADTTTTDPTRFQGPKLKVFEVDSSFVSGSQTAGEVASKVRRLLERRSSPWRNRWRRFRGKKPVGLTVGVSEHVTLFFCGEPMQDDALFYADHFMMLPVWVQVVLHDCEREEFLERIGALDEPERGE